jgi:DNA-binding protein, YbaB/EbfC family
MPFPFLARRFLTFGLPKPIDPTLQTRRSIDVRTRYIKKAQEFQANLAAAKDEISRLVVVGQSDNGFVQLQMNGRFEVLSLTINPALYEQDKSIISSLIISAMNNASGKVREETAKALEKATGMGPGNPLASLGLPGF